MAKVNYNSETREQVIKLVLKGEKSANQVAKELGIGPNTVGRWVADNDAEYVIAEIVLCCVIYITL